MSSVRLRRLRADHDRLQDYVRRHPRVTLVAASGDPPESYQIEYQLRSLRHVSDEIKVVTKHLVEIMLPGSYPRLPPQCRMLTPIFHPNIAPHAICIGDHWSAGEPLWNIVARIGEMIAYQSYNVKSPLNGEAARWVSENAEQLPLDPVSMLTEDGPAGETSETSGDGRPREPARADGPEAPRAEQAPPEPAPAARKIQVSCPHCGAQLRVAAAAAGKRARCPKCQAIVPVPEEA